MGGPRGLRKTSTDDPAAIIGTQDHDLSSAYALV